MSKLNFFILLAVMGFVYIGSAGIGFMQNDGNAGSSDPQALQARFAKSFGWLQSKSISSDELTCDSNNIFRRGEMLLVFTQANPSCTLTSKASSKRSLKLSLEQPVAGKLIVTAPSPETGQPKNVDLPAMSNGATYSEASWVLKVGDTVKIVWVPNGTAECRVRIDH